MPSQLVTTLTRTLAGIDEAISILNIEISALVNKERLLDIEPDLLCMFQDQKEELLARRAQCERWIEGARNSTQS